MIAKQGRKRARKAVKPTSIVPDHFADLNPDQARAVAELTAAINRGDPICRLLGYAGTGKSFSVVRLLRVYATDRPVILSAPTNKAAAVLRAMAFELGGKVRATTIHKVLGLRPEVDTDRGRCFLRKVKEMDVPKGALVVIDECSMVDSELLRFIIKGAQDANAQILFVGDPAQLPPIFEAESPSFCGEGVTARLTQIVRQQADHPILAMTQRIRDAMAGGPVPVFQTHRGESGSLIHLDAADFETELLATMKSAAYQTDADHCRVLCWTNGKSDSYNRMVRRALLGPVADEQSLLADETVIACSSILEAGISIGDTVMVLEATPDVHYSIPCIKAKIPVIKGKALDVWVVRPDGRDAYRQELSRLAKFAKSLQDEHNAHRSANSLHLYPQVQDKKRREAWVQFFGFKDSMFADLRPVHSSTVHRSQGSTFNRVFVDLTDIGRSTRKDVLLKLLYVALTRASGDVYVTGVLPDRLYREQEIEAAMT
jgi:exodeoxyribonuclease-5